MLNDNRTHGRRTGTEFWTFSPTAGLAKGKRCSPCMRTFDEELPNLVRYQGKGRFLSVHLSHAPRNKGTPCKGKKKVNSTILSAALLGCLRWEPDISIHGSLLCKWGYDYCLTHGQWDARRTVRSNFPRYSIFFKISVLGASWTSWGYKISGRHDWSWST